MYAIDIIKDEKKQDFQKDISGNTNPAVINNDFIEKENNNSSSQESNNILVDINNDSEIIISKLPDVNLIIAKKIVEIMSSEYEFYSIENLVEKLNLNMVMVERLMPFVKLSMGNRDKTKGRKVDSNVLIYK